MSAKIISVDLAPPFTPLDLVCSFFFIGIGVSPSDYLLFHTLTYYFFLCSLSCSFCPELCFLSFFFFFSETFRCVQLGYAHLWTMATTGSVGDQVTCDNQSMFTFFACFQGLQRRCHSVNFVECTLTKGTLTLKNTCSQTLFGEPFAS